MKNQPTIRTIKDYMQHRKMLAEAIRISRALDRKERHRENPSDAAIQLHVHIVEGTIILHQMEDLLKLKTKRMTAKQAFDSLVEKGCDPKELRRLIGNVARSA